jgi:hypothetical protein
MRMTQLVTPCFDSDRIALVDCFYSESSFFRRKRQVSSGSAGRTGIGFESRADPPFVRDHVTLGAVVFTVRWVMTICGLSVAHCELGYGFASEKINATSSTEQCWTTLEVTAVCVNHHFFFHTANMTDWVAKAKQYVSWDPNAETRAEIQKDIDNNDVKALEAKLGERLEFGTAGLRGPMGAGYNKMNDLVVIQSTQGVCKYLLQCFGDKAKEMGFVVGYVGHFL